MTEPSPEVVEQIRLEIENQLIEWRDNRTSVIGRGNGLVIRERDGKESSIIRMTTGDAVHFAIKRYLELTGGTK